MIMCVLCGALKTSFHWSEIKNDESMCEIAAYTRELTRSRYLKISILNEILKHYMLEINVWQGESFLLSDKKGNTLIINDLTSLWKSVEKLGVKIDPLSDSFLSICGG